MIMLHTGIFNSIIALLLSVSPKEFWKSISIWWNYNVKNFFAYFFGPLYRNETRGRFASVEFLRAEFDGHFSSRWRSGQRCLIKCAWRHDPRKLCSVLNFSLCTPPQHAYHASAMQRKRCLGHNKLRPLYVLATHLPHIRRRWQSAVTGSYRAVKSADRPRLTARVVSVLSVVNSRAWRVYVVLAARKHFLFVRRVATRWWRG